jgi:hypothetical protein
VTYIVEPGSADAVKAGCTCPKEQPQADVRAFDCDKDCPLHGLHVIKQLSEANFL